VKFSRLLLTACLIALPAAAFADDDSWSDDTRPIDEFSKGLQDTVDDAATSNPPGTFLKAAHDNVKSQLDEPEDDHSADDDHGDDEN
jgi:hypothetical protein